MKNIRFKLMAVAMVASIVVLGLLAIFQTVSIGSLLVDQSLRRLEYRGALVASQLNGWLENQIGYLNAAAEDTNWIMEYRDDDTLSNILENHYKSSENNFFQILFGYPDGPAWFSSGWEPDRNTWRADRQEWYSGALKEPGTVFVSDPYRDEKTGDYCVAISKAILRGEELLAIVGADIYIENIRKITNEVPIMEGRGFAFLIAEDTGIVLVHPNPDYMPGEDGRFKTVYDIGNTYAALLDVPDGETIHIERPNGTRRYYSSHSISSAGWKLFSTVNERVILDPINRGVGIEVALSFMVFVLVCVLLFVTSRAQGKAARTAQDHSDMKTTFLANMSHEIRTPMNGIIGFAELALENTEITGQTREYLEKIRNSTK
ncbi:MAG: hypothetical protein LBT39_08715, partial [Treponema sp.]|nr:hypothetical protein [Treponema sp.]